VDIGLANGTEFLLWAGIGLDGRIVNTIEPRMRWEKAFGALQYGILALWNSIGWEGIELRVQSEGKVWEDRFLVAVASNIRSYAGGVVELSPQAKIDDGLLDFWLITGSTLKDAVGPLIQVLRGTHEQAPGVIHFKSQEAILEATGDIPMQFDGEPFMMNSPVHFESRRKTLRVLLPSDARQQLFTSAEVV
jgi:diacylglycerol kinase family enzyme